jgi:hypothetical protein
MAMAKIKLKAMRLTDQDDHLELADDPLAKAKSKAKSKKVKPKGALKTKAMMPKKKQAVAKPRAPKRPPMSLIELIAWTRRFKR